MKKFVWVAVLVGCAVAGWFLRKKVKSERVPDEEYYGV